MDRVIGVILFSYFEYIVTCKSNVHMPWIMQEKFSIRNLPRLSLQLVLLCCIFSFNRFLSLCLVVRGSASVAVSHGFAPRSRHTKGVKIGTSSSLADARSIRVVLGRSSKTTIRYLLCRKIAHELILSVKNNQRR